MSDKKLASQAGHAYVDAFDCARTQNPEIATQYKEDHHGIKVCLGVNSLEELLEIADRCVDAGIKPKIITDLGYTCFDGVPTVTAIGFGPIKRDVAKPICGHLRAS